MKIFARRRALTLALALLALAAGLLTTLSPRAACAEDALSYYDAGAYADGILLRMGGAALETPRRARLYALPLAADADVPLSLRGAGAAYVALSLKGGDGCFLPFEGFVPAQRVACQLSIPAEGGMEDGAVRVLVVRDASYAAEAPAALAFRDKKLAVFAGERTALPMTGQPDGAARGGVTFSTANRKVATVDAHGVVTALAKGSTVVTARGVNAAGEKWSVKCTLNVTRPVLTVTAKEPEITVRLGASVTAGAVAAPANATNRALAYRSGDTAVFKVSAAGKITPVAVGAADLFIVSKSNPEAAATARVYVIQPVKKVTITAEPDSLYVGGQARLSIAYQPENATRRGVAFKSSNPKLATVDEAGVVTALAKGTVTITATATDGGRASAKKKLTIRQQLTGLTLPQSSATLAAGKTLTLKPVLTPKSANDRALVFESSSPSVVTVSEKGVLRGVYPGDAVVTVSAARFPDVYASMLVHVVQLAQKVTLTPSAVNLFAGDETQLTFAVLPDYTTDPSVAFTSSNQRVAMVDNTGRVTAIGPGTATITVTCQDAGRARARATVNVIQPVTGMYVWPEEAHVGVGEEATLHAELQPENATDRRVRWYSSAPGIARVSGTSTTAVVTGIQWGDAILTAESADGGFVAEATVAVGDYNRAVVVDSVWIDEYGAPGLIFRNDSNLTMTRVTFQLTGYDAEGNLLPIHPDGGYLLPCTYRGEVYPTESISSSGKTFGGVYDGMEMFMVCITGYRTDSGLQYTIPEELREYETFSTDAYRAANPEDDGELHDDEALPEEGFDAPAEDPDEDGARG